MDHLPDETLVDSIYEASVVPEMWPAVLARVTSLADGAFASVFAQKNDTINWVGTPEADVLIGEYVALKQPGLNSRIPRFSPNPHAGFITDLDVFTEEEIAADPFYQEFMYPRGYGWVASRHVFSPSGEAVVVSIERQRDRGPFERKIVDRLDLLGPHLARSTLLTARLNFNRARAMADTLQSLGLPGAVLRGGGKVLAVNDGLERLMPSLLQDRRERLHLADAAADALLEEALSRRSIRGGPISVNSIPVAATEEHPPMILHLLPVRGAANDIFSQATSLLVVTPVDRAVVPTAKVLQGLFDLTPAEARVARGISEAQSVEALALSAGVSVETVRSQLKTVLAKTGLSRQQELINLLAGNMLPVTKGAPPA